MLPVGDDQAPGGPPALVTIGLVGFVLDRFLYRYLRTAPEIARLVTSLGLLVAGPSIVQLWFGSSSAFGPPSIWPHPDAFYRFGQYALDLVADEAVVPLLVTAECAVLSEESGLTGAPDGCGVRRSPGHSPA